MSCPGQGSNFDQARPLKTRTVLVKSGRLRALFLGNTHTNAAFPVLEAYVVE